jgi:hypothetical protein
MVVMKNNNSGKLGSTASLKCGTASSDLISHKNPYHPANITKIFVAHILLYLKNKALKMRLNAHTPL